MELPQKISGEEIAFARNNFTQKLDFHVLWFKRRRAYKSQEEKKGKNKEMNLIVAKSGLVGMKGYLKTYNHIKSFLTYLSRF